MKAIIITGASSGIGTALCKCYAENGYYVFGSVRNTKDAKDLNVVLGDSCTDFDTWVVLHQV